jgi:hypothetical protein
MSYCPDYPSVYAYRSTFLRDKLFVSLDEAREFDLAYARSYVAGVETDVRLGAAIAAGDPTLKRALELLLEEILNVAAPEGFTA